MIVFVLLAAFCSAEQIFAAPDAPYSKALLIE